MLRHVGDLGNVESNNSGGTTVVMVEDSEISLQNNSTSNILNRSIVIHKHADNFTGSSGYAGARIACGIIIPSSANGSRRFMIYLMKLF